MFGKTEQSGEQNSQKPRKQNLAIFGGSSESAISAEKLHTPLGRVNQKQSKRA